MDFFTELDLCNLMMGIKYLIIEVLFNDVGTSFHNLEKYLMFEPKNCKFEH